MLHLTFLLLLPVLFHSFKFHTHALLSSHFLCLCKKTLSSMTSSYVTPFSLTKTWILLFLFPLLQRLLSSTHSTRSFIYGSHTRLLLSPCVFFLATSLMLFLHFSSIKYDPCPPSPIIFLLSALHAAVLFSFVLWFQLKAFLYFHHIPCMSLLIHPIPLPESPTFPFCAQLVFFLQLTLYLSLLSCTDFHQPYSQISDAMFLPFKQWSYIFQLHT